MLKNPIVMTWKEDYGGKTAIKYYNYSLSPSPRAERGNPENNPLIRSSRISWIASSGFALLAILAMTRIEDGLCKNEFNDLKIKQTPALFFPCNHFAFDITNGRGGVEALGAGFGAVHNGVTAVELESII